MSGTPDWLTPLGLRAATAEALDGVDAPRPTGPAYRPRASAVLVLLGEDPFHGPYVLVLQRAATLRNHAGQIAFPGGAADPEDTDAIATALREAAEEVGLDPSGVRILATLPPRWVPASNYLVTPVLAWWATPHEVRPVDDAEVARVDRLTIAELAAPANRLRLRHPGGWIGPAFRTRGMLVWGFTAGVLSTLLDLGGWAQPWPTGPIEELHRSCDPPVL